MREYDPGWGDSPEEKIKHEQYYEREAERKKTKMKKQNDLPINKKYFYYLRDEYGLPRVTICLAHFTDEDVICRGLAICSTLDQPTKRLGNLIAAGRAIKAYKLKESCRPVMRDEAFYNIEMLEDSSFLTLPNMDKITKMGSRYSKDFYKCYYNPKLTDYEMSLMNP